MKRISAFLFLLVLVFAMVACSNPESKYNTALQAMEQEDWDQAIELFGSIDYSDSAELLKECQKEKGMHEKADYEFLDTMAVSLMKRYDESRIKGDLEKLASIEFEMISTFKGAEFYDSHLKDLAAQYIEGVEREKESCVAHKGEDQFIYYEGHAKRFSALKQLTDEYGFLADNVDYKTEYYNNAEREVERYNAYVAIDEDLAQYFPAHGLEVDYVDDYTYRITIENHTKYTYDMVLHFTFYDADGTIVTTDNVYYEDIQAGKKYNLDFFYPIEADTFDWYYEILLDI